MNDQNYEEIKLDVSVCETSDGYLRVHWEQNEETRRERSGNNRKHRTMGTAGIVETRSKVQDT
jgi:hypothetical protein